MQKKKNLLIQPVFINFELSCIERKVRISISKNGLFMLSLMKKYLLIRKRHLVYDNCFKHIKLTKMCYNSKLKLLKAYLSF